MPNTVRTILITGFEPFGGQNVNASWEAAQKLEGWRHGECVAAARLLPCAYDASVKELIRAIETFRPEALLMTGQAARRAAVSVERFAYNFDNAGARDNAGVLRQAVRISEGAPDRLDAAAPINAIVDAIRAAGVPVRASRDAGGFVCNHLYFGALQYLGGLKRPVPAVFLHLPPTPEQAPSGVKAKPLTPAKAADALRAAAAVLIDLSESSAAA
jgi:pyroglutamyl-peptidase